MCSIRMLNFYSWTSNFYLTNTSDLFLNTLNWEDSSFLLDNDLFLNIDLFLSTFTSIYFSYINISPLALLDFILFTFNSTINLMSKSLLLDFVCWFESLNNTIDLLFVSYSVDYLMLEILFDNSLTLLTTSFVSYFHNFVLSWTPTGLYDSLITNFGYALLDYFVYLKWFVIFFFFIFSLSPLKFFKVHFTFKFHYNSVFLLHIIF